MSLLWEATNLIRVKPLEKDYIMSETNTFGFTVLKNGLFFDVFDKEGLAESIKVFGNNYAVIGIKEALNGIIPSEFDGIGGYFDGDKFYKDYIIVLSTKEPIIFKAVVLKTIGWLYQQLSILLVEEGKPSIVETNELPEMDYIKDAVDILGRKTIQLLYHVRSGWETDYKEIGVK